MGITLLQFIEIKHDELMNQLKEIFNDSNGYHIDVNNAKNREIYSKTIISQRL